MPTATFHIWRGDKTGGEFKAYTAQIGEGTVVLDAVREIQETQAGDLACRWNCKAGKCGSCSAEINGKPRLMCQTRMETLPIDKPVIVKPLKTFPIIRDLVTDVSWNYKINRMIPPFTPRPRDPDGHWHMQQADVDRVQEFRKCIECFLCQDVCHVLREHRKMGEPSGAELFGGPRFMIRVASLDMHPLDTIDRLPLLRDKLNIGFCNITKCCTEVCPEHIHITDNGIIPMKERVVDQYYDPVMWLWHKVFGDSRASRKKVTELPMVR